MPTLADETASFNTTTCQWDVEGTSRLQRLRLLRDCFVQRYDLSVGRNGYATGHADACCYDRFVQHYYLSVGRNGHSQPTLACYETASFTDLFLGRNDRLLTRLQWFNTQPAMPTLACYETASFNGHDLSVDVTGTADYADACLL